MKYFGVWFAAVTWLLCAGCASTEQSSYVSSTERVEQTEKERLEREEPLWSNPNFRKMVLAHVQAYLELVEAGDTDVAENMLAWGSKRISWLTEFEPPKIAESQKHGFTTATVDVRVKQASWDIYWFTIIVPDDFVAPEPEADWEFTEDVGLRLKLLGSYLSTRERHGG